MSYRGIGYYAIGVKELIFLKPRLFTSRKKSLQIANKIFKVSSQNLGSEGTRKTLYIYLGLSFEFKCAAGDLFLKITLFPEILHLEQFLLAFLCYRKSN